MIKPLIHHGSLWLLFLCLSGCAAQDQESSTGATGTAMQDASTKKPSGVEDRSQPLRWKFQVGQLAKAATESLSVMLENRILVQPGVKRIATEIKTGEFTMQVTPAPDAPADLVDRVEAILVKGTHYPFVRVKD